MNFKQAFLFTVLCAVIITTAFFAGYLTHAELTPPAELEVLHQAHKILLKHGLDVPTDDSILEYGMIRGMLQAYGDPHSSFSEPAQAELSSNVLEGSFGGIGVSVEIDPQGFHILFPFPEGPAAKAGIQDGDRLVQVDELKIMPDTSTDTLTAAVRGPVGEKVKIIIARPPDYQTFTYTIKREQISLPSVTWRLVTEEPRLGLIKVNLIAATTPDEIQKAVKDLQSKGASAFALDLRDNYGGLLTSGVDIARLFLASGLVIEQQYRAQPVEQYNVIEKGPLSSIPLVLLVNQNTASAAEIITGALQAQKRAVVIGAPTYGKNTIQLVFQLMDGSSINITSARWWVPGLDKPQAGQGIKPDISITETEGNPDPYIKAAIEELFLK